MGYKKIWSLRQGACSTSVYASDSRQFVSDKNWGEETLVRDDVKDLLLTLPDPQTLKKIISQAVKCDNRLFQRRQDQRPRQQTTRYDVTMTVRSLDSHFEAEDMQIDTAHVITLTPEEKNRRIKEGLCLYCGEEGHKLVNCPKKQNRRTVKTRSTVIPEKQRCPAAIGSMRLDNPMSQEQLGSYFSAQPTHFFSISLSLGSLKQKTLALLNSGASICFLHEEFAKRHKIRLVQRSKPIHVEMKDGRSLLSSSVTHESEPIEVTFKYHSSFLVFNIIRITSNHVILGLFWFVDYNPSIN